MAIQCTAAPAVIDSVAGNVTVNAVMVDASTVAWA